MNPEEKRRCVVISIALAIIIVISGLAIVLPASAAKAPDGGPDYNKLDVGIYGDVNSEGNPTDADPKDGQMFRVYVTSVERKYLDDGTLIETVVRPIGYFTSSQFAAGQFPYSSGKPYSSRHCEGVELLGHCIGTWTNTEGYYHIDYRDEHGNSMIPYGYCPQYPDGQDRKKSGTTTENLKFFKDEACGKLYPGFDGWFGYCMGTHKRCFIVIR